MQPRALCFLIALSVCASTHARAGEADAGDAAFKRKDYATALKLLMPLAEKGDVTAEVDVGIMYYGGLGMPLNRAEGVKWFAAAAKQGTVGAEVDMGIAYATGEGVQQDRSRAYMWFSLAADQGSAPAVQYRDHIATELTPEQIQSAQELAKSCRVSNYKICWLP